MASGQAVLGPSQLLEPFRGWRFELGNPRIYIRPYVTLAEPADLQDFSKDKKNKPTRGTLAPGSLPRGKGEGTELSVSQYRRRSERSLVTATGPARREDQAAEFAWLLYIKVYYIWKIYCTGKNPLD